MQLTDYFAQQPEVIVAYLFGSRATGKARPDSDWDIAVLLTPADSYTHLEHRLRMMTHLELRLEQSVDLIVLNQATPSLIHEVLIHKILLFERDKDARVEFEVRAGQIYADLLPGYRLHEAAMFTRIKEGRFGRPAHQRKTRQPLEFA